ncbi:peptide chain release factor N(5)-glutamine methyltransferase [Nonlabens agnitus]|uniref:peptide chain release factor N(5)-glutamine methyltransferase n=1 Tax=Nonlabens agnitus TaxID=870484 RepID=A0A2S9WRJ2_9FLAO|nr:peptide chain release factor N(5)-glutamine methyltransferase [Nonlabens agnitus]PRP66104.1 protein-(glutamine-N5) methyltransferase, release factor-specific [Nonlabens agnitus]
MTLRQLRDIYVSRLVDLYPENEIVSIFKIVCEDLLYMSKSDIMIRGEEPLSHLKEEILLRSLETLLAGTPVQHITGIGHFYDHEFKVNEHTLIPRQETEELVQWILDDHKGKQINSILDIGTGSGCIGVSLGNAFAKANSLKSSTKIILLDLSKNALQVAASNAEAISPEVNFELIHQDILATEKLEPFDIIVSNPPYVRELEKPELHKNVLDFDPEMALFVENEDPLVFYRKILELAKDHNNPLVYFEINQYLSKEMKQLAIQLDYKHELRKDLNGNWRMMKCWK